ncbi:fumarylacetoacetate hydrolase family protein [Leucobacter allii]|uniref:fumarylacetoacetate hydrolase family protein n=1 Tax=Leucobacter allii TaxID=2932247 RepID=UPI001FCFC2DF|nr:fumarylacetoacetate hydrolase family protein [Leucobacter allii]UOR02675.1 fumarylacetoacetate hydrolase family protein [Leucobacter allii]
MTHTTWPASLTDSLPLDHDAATLIGRAWDPRVAGPSPVLVTAHEVRDLSGTFATVSELMSADEPAAAARAAAGAVLGSAEEILAATMRRDRSATRFLSPIDLQCVKAAGVTFAVSMIERVIEERARGDAAEADRVRAQVLEVIGGDLGAIEPGSPGAMRLKSYLIDQGLWSQYLEVGIGPDAEIFTKCPVLASVGTGEEIGVRRTSEWNNPEPEVVLVLDGSGRILGATLGNDLNLRDYEGRSALLLPEAKDNNASASLGPFIRLFDERFSLDDVRRAEVELRVQGEDGFELRASSDMSLISRDPEDLVSNLLGPHHQYPDGAVLYLGTLFAPTEDRGEPGAGFTHRVGDVVRISSPKLGALVNRVAHSETCAPWEFGVGALMRNLAERGLLR